MMPNIVKGSDMGGLIRYLVGPGRSNEHAEQHLVAGDPAVAAWHGYDELSRSAAGEIARALDQPRRILRPDVTVKHVFHCSLSIAAGDGQLTDEQWAAIAEDFIQEMGFNDGVKAPARWVAIRHGLSSAGNDHLHIAASLIREDGTKVSVHDDFNRAQRTVNRLEKKHGLAVLDSRELSIGGRGYSPAEHRRMTAANQIEPERVTLARRVRAHAAGATTEADFVDACRQSSLLVRPRFAAGRDDVVVGFSVAMRPPQGGGKPIWFGGGHLARDLTLPRLREAWPDDPIHASAAAAAWKGAGRQQPSSPARYAAGQTWRADRYSALVTDLRTQMSELTPEDRAGWALASTRLAGLFAAWSTASETQPGPLAEAADALARYAQVRRSVVPISPVKMPSTSGAVMLLMQAAASSPTFDMAVMLRQLTQLIVVVAESHRARHELGLALRMEDLAHHRLRAVQSRLAPIPAAAALGPVLHPASAGPAVPAARDASTPDVEPVIADAELIRIQQLRDLGRGPGSPLPNRLPPRRDDTAGARQSSPDAPAQTPTGPHHHQGRK